MTSARHPSGKVSLSRSAEVKRCTWAAVLVIALSRLAGCPSLYGGAQERQRSTPDLSSAKVGRDDWKRCPYSPAS